MEFDGNTVLCRVCGDRSSGFHYGVHACEGCKGFFRRSIQQKIQYRPCLKNQLCLITRVNRNRCQYCRLKKSIAVGMSRDAVRFGRVPKREKAKILEQMQRVNDVSYHSSRIEMVMGTNAQLIERVVCAHLATCEFTRSKVKQFVQAAWLRDEEEDVKGSFTNGQAPMSCPLNPYPDLMGSAYRWGELSESFLPAIRNVVNFAQSIPSFSLLGRDDQVILLKIGAFEVLLVNLCSLFDPQTNSVIFTNGQIYRTTDTSSNGACYLLDSVFDFAQRFNALQLLDEEVALFSALILLASDRPGLRGVDVVERIQRRLIDCLQILINKNHPLPSSSPQHGSVYCNSGPDSTFNKLIISLSELRLLNAVHSEKLLGISLPYSSCQTFINQELPQPHVQQHSHNQFQVWQQKQQDQQEQRRQQPFDETNTFKEDPLFITPGVPEYKRNGGKSVVTNDLKNINGMTYMEGGGNETIKLAYEHTRNPTFFSIKDFVSNDRPKIVQNEVNCSNEEWYVDQNKDMNDDRHKTDLKPGSTSFDDVSIDADKVEQQAVDLNYNINKSSLSNSVDKSTSYKPRPITPDFDRVSHPNRQSHIHAPSSTIIPTQQPIIGHQMSRDRCPQAELLLTTSLGTFHRTPFCPWVTNSKDENDVKANQDKLPTHQQTDKHSDSWNVAVAKERTASAQAAIFLESDTPPSTRHVHQAVRVVGNVDDNLKEGTEVSNLWKNNMNPAVTSASLSCSQSRCSSLSAQTQPATPTTSEPRPISRATDLEPCSPKSMQHESRNNCRTGYRLAAEHSQSVLSQQQSNGINSVDPEAMGHSILHPQPIQLTKFLLQSASPSSNQVQSTHLCSPTSSKTVNPILRNRQSVYTFNMMSHIIPLSNETAQPRSTVNRKLSVNARISHAVMRPWSDEDDSGKDCSSPHTIVNNSKQNHYGQPVKKSVQNRNAPSTNHCSSHISTQASRVAVNKFDMCDL